MIYLLDDFQWIEEVIENVGLAKFIDETESDERLAGDAAKEYYESLKAGEWVERSETSMDGGWTSWVSANASTYLHGLS